MSDNTQEEAHTGPIKTPKQLLVTVFFAFVVPVVHHHRPGGLRDRRKQAGRQRRRPRRTPWAASRRRTWSAASPIASARSARSRSATPNRPLKSGEEVFKAQCTTCHTAGVAGAPKFGDAGAWAARIKTGFDALVHFGAARARAPCRRRAVATSTTSRSPVRWPTWPMRPAPSSPSPQPRHPRSRPMPAPLLPRLQLHPRRRPLRLQPPQRPQTVATAAPAPAAPAAGNGEATYKQACFACHARGRGRCAQVRRQGRLGAAHRARPAGPVQRSAQGQGRHASQGRQRRSRCRHQGRRRLHGGLRQVSSAQALAKKPVMDRLFSWAPGRRPHAPVGSRRWGCFPTGGAARRASRSPLRRSWSRACKESHRWSPPWPWLAFSLRAVVAEADPVTAR